MVGNRGLSVSDNNAFVCGLLPILVAASRAGEAFPAGRLVSDSSRLAFRPTVLVTYVFDLIVLLVIKPRRIAARLRPLLTLLGGGVRSGTELVWVERARSKFGHDGLRLMFRQSVLHLGRAVFGPSSKAVLSWTVVKVCGHALL